MLVNARSVPSGRMVRAMNIAILGTGAIGSTFAYHLSKAGHTVTAIARGQREEQLRRDGAIVLVSGERTPVEVAPQLDVTRPFDLVICTVLAPQVGAVLPALRASAAKQIMFMFNTFESLEPLREAVGPARCLFGFPAGVLARLVEGKLTFQLLPGTTIGDEAWAKTISKAGISCVVEADMHSWLRSHAAMVIPLMAGAVTAYRRKAGNTWAEARAYAEAFFAGIQIVRDLGHPVKPAMISIASRFPKVIITFLLWAMSRTQTQQDLGVLGPAEARMLIDMITAAAPGKTGALLAIRPE